MTPPALLPGQSFSFAAPSDAVSGGVLLEIEVSVTGEVSNARALEARLSDGADKASIEASALAHVQSLRFRPALRDQQPVAARTRVLLKVQSAAAMPAAARAVELPQPAEQSGAKATDEAAALRSSATAKEAAPAERRQSASGHAPAGQVSGPLAQLLQPSAADAGVLEGAPSVADNAPAASAPASDETKGHASDPASRVEVPPHQHPLGEVPAHQHSVRPVSPPMAADHAAHPASDYAAHAHLKGATGPAAPVAASDMDFELGALRAVPRRDAQSYLSLAPGLVLGNHSGIGHANSIFLRGFDAGEGQDVEVRVDGVPINEPSNAHAHGYADTQFVIPETVQRLRVQQGVFDPAQSDFAVAGSAAYQLGVRQRGLSAQLGYGRFNEQRGLVLWAPSDATSGTFAALDLRRGDGFGPNRAHQSASALLRYARAAGPLHYALLAGGHAQQFDSAGVVREDDVNARRLPCPRSEDSQFFCTADPQQGGSGQRYLLSGKLSWARPARRYELQVYGMSRQLRMRENFTGSLLSEAGDGLDQSYAVTTVGAHGSYTMTPRLWGQRQRFELGLEARHDRGETRMWRLRREGGIPYETVFDRELSLMHVGGYVRAELNPLRPLSLRFGGRVDAFSYHTENQAAPEADRVGSRLTQDARDAWGTALSPRASLVLHALPGLDWTVSAGQGVRSSDAEALSQGERAPFTRVLSLESGPTWTRKLASAHLEAHAFAFATRVAQDLLFDAERGRNVPVGPSNRYGVSLSARARIGLDHDSLLSATWADARAIERDVGIFELGRGQALPYVPRAVLRFDQASRFHVRLGDLPLQLTAAGGVGWVGARPLPLGAKTQPTWEVDLSASARYRWLELGASVSNLFDVRNRAVELNYVSSFAATAPGGAVSMRPARHFSAAAPRTWWLTLTVYFADLESN